MRFFPLQWSKYCERQNKMKKEHQFCARSFTLIATILLLQSPVTGKMFSDPSTSHNPLSIEIPFKLKKITFVSSYLTVDGRFDKFFPPVKLQPHKLYLNWFPVIFNIYNLRISYNLVIFFHIFLIKVDEVKSTLLFNKIN